MTSKRRKTKKMQFRNTVLSFMSPFHLLVILAGLFLIVFLILELLSPATFRQNTKVFAACQVKPITIYAIPYADSVTMYADEDCFVVLPTIDTLPFTIGATTYYQLPASITYYKL